MATIKSLKPKDVLKSTELNPSGRLSTTEDVANVVAFLSSSQSDYLNGISIPVAGGSFTN